MKATLSMGLLLRLLGLAPLVCVEAYAGVLGGPLTRRAAPHRDHRLRPTLALDSGGAAIAVRNLDLWAGSSPLILDVNWDVRPKERWALVGPNGAGKSTLLRAIGEAAGGTRFEEDGELEVGQQFVPAAHVAVTADERRTEPHLTSA